MLEEARAVRQVHPFFPVGNGLPEHVDCTALPKGGSTIIPSEGSLSTASLLVLEKVGTAQASSPKQAAGVWFLRGAGSLVLNQLQNVFQEWVTHLTWPGFLGEWT